MRKALFILTVFIFLAASCSPRNTPTATATAPPAGETVAADEVKALVCGSQTGCLAKICPISEPCPLTIALSNKAVFEFVKTYSECEGCDTPDFPPGKGIGKCVEYQVTSAIAVQTVTFWVSGNCAFRHADPTQARIVVTISQAGSTIESIVPDTAYIENPSYCRVESDCNGLSGSGLPLIGCSNFLYAFLSWAGYYPASQDLCTCVANQCRQK